MNTKFHRQLINVVYLFTASAQLLLGIEAVCLAKQKCACFFYCAKIKQEDIVHILHKF